MTGFAIRMVNGGYVSGFSRQHLCVQFAGDAAHVKAFRSEKSARAFVAKYADKGYGMTRFVQIVPLP